MEMTCPKCGAVQPESDVCSKCQVIIEKYLQYLERKQEQVAQQPLEEAPAQKKAGSTGKIIVAFVVTAILWNKGHLPSAVYSNHGNYSPISGFYENTYYGFSVELPENWKQYTVKEKLPPAFQAYSKFYHFLGAPENTSSYLFVINTASVSAESFISDTWAGWVAYKAKTHKIIFDEVEDVSGFTIHKVGYMIRNVYREDHLFIAKGKLIELYFYVKPSEDKDEITQQMRDALSTLKKI